MILKCQKNYQIENKEEPLTPNSKTEAFMHNLISMSTEDKQKVKRVLLEKNILTEAIAEQYANSQSNKERNIIKNITNRALITKYKMRTQIGRFLGLKGRIRGSNRQRENVAHRNLIETITRFYLQDDVSRPSAGKKETRTLNKTKMQKRYMLDNLINLYKKFKGETESTICYTTFVRHKPFYVVNLLLSNRDTCVCKIHSNIEFKFKALKNKSSLNGYKELIEVVKDTVCDYNSKECMHGECQSCNIMSVNYSSLINQEHENVTWLEWVFKRTEYTKHGQIKTSKRVIKEEQYGVIKDLMVKFDKELKEFKVHIYNIKHQYKCYKHLKDNLEPNEVILHCDFSKNYTGKFHTEIQAVHFGASHQQITLHTSVVYTKSSRPQSYCTLSDSLNHSPVAIWAHLMPVLSDIKKVRSKF